jgi:hypothetical protein
LDAEDFRECLLLMKEIEPFRKQGQDAFNAIRFSRVFGFSRESGGRRARLMVVSRLSGIKSIFLAEWMRPEPRKDS